MRIQYIASSKTSAAMKDQSLNNINSSTSLLLDELNRGSEIIGRPIKKTQCQSDWPPRHNGPGAKANNTAARYHPYQVYPADTYAPSHSAAHDIHHLFIDIPQFINPFASGSSGNSLTFTDVPVSPLDTRSLRPGARFNAKRRKSCGLARLRKIAPRPINTVAAARDNTTKPNVVILQVYDEVENSAPWPPRFSRIGKNVHGGRLAAPTAPLVQPVPLPGYYGHSYYSRQ